MERRPDAQATLDIHLREVALPKGVPVLRLDGHIAALDPVAGQQGVDILLAVGKALARNVGLQQVRLRLEALERILREFGHENLAAFGVRNRDIEYHIVHIRVIFSYLRNTKLLQKSGIRKNEVIELIYRSFI